MKSKAIEYGRQVVAKAEARLIDKFNRGYNNVGGNMLLGYRTTDDVDFYVRYHFPGRTMIKREGHNYTPSHAAYRVYRKSDADGLFKGWLAELDRATAMGDEAGVEEAGAELEALYEKVLNVNAFTAEYQRQIRARKKEANALLKPRKCEHCGEPLEPAAHARKKFCRDACRVAAFRRK